MALLYRIASAGPKWDELDLTGQAAKAVGGRWNDAGTAATYAAQSIALAVLETIVHLGAMRMMFDRYVVEIEVPRSLFRRRTVVVPPPPEAWNSIPASYKSARFGTQWLKQAKSLVLDVPSVIVPQERCYVINPAHPRSGEVKARNLGRFLYDPRLRPTVM
jgi:RES domain-containing protein